MPPAPGLTGTADTVDSQLWHFSITNAYGTFVTCYWGDGSQTSEPIQSSPQDVALDHRYDAAGDYTVTAHTSAGNQQDSQLTITVIASTVTPPEPEDSFSAYTTVEELFRVLSVRSPTAAQTVAAQRVIDTAAGEINSEIDLASGSALEDWQLQLCGSVNLDRAADLWRHSESAPGVLTVMDDSLPSVPGRYSWERYAQRLAPLKDQWGIA